MATINKQTGIVGTGSENQTTSIATPLAEGELGLQQNRGEISVGTKNGNVVLEGTVLTDKRIADKAKSGFLSSGVINKQDDANIFQAVVGNEYKMANTDRFVNFDGKVIDTYGPELITNGDFSDGTTGWTASNASITYNNGRIRIADGGIYTSAEQLISGLTIGATYKINADMFYIEGTYNTYLAVSYTASDSTSNYVSNSVEASSSGAMELYFTAEETTAYIKLLVESTNTSVEYDNISVREIKTIDMTNDIPEVTVQDQATNGLVVQSIVGAGDYVVVDKEELVTNGTFDTDVSGWTPSAGANISLNNNVVELTASGSGYSNFYQNIPTVVGLKYTVSCYAKKGTGGNAGLQVGLPSPITVNTSNSVSFEKLTITFTAVSISTAIRGIDIQSNSSGTTFYDNFSVQLASDVYRAKQDTPSGTSLTNTTYYEDRTQFGITNKILATMKDDGTIKTEVCFVDTAIEDCGNAHIVMTDNGYSKLSNGLYSKGTDVVTPIGTWSTLNKGAFHPVYNYFGIRLFQDASYVNGNLWYANDLDFTVNTSITFSKAQLTGNYNGAVGTTPLRPDSKFYNIIYKDQWIDLRIEANAISEQDELNRVGTKAKSGSLDGIGGVVATYADIGGQSNGDVAPAASMNLNWTTPIPIKIGSIVYSENPDGTFSWGQVKAGQTITTAGGSFAIYDDIYRNVIGITALTNPYGSLIGRKLNGTISTVKTLPHPSSGTALRTDWIGDPQFYPQQVKDRLASGLPMIGMNPLLVNQDGTSALPDVSGVTFTFSNKIVDYYKRIYTVDSGINWNTLVSSINSIGNSMTSSATSSTVLLETYTAKIPTTQVSDPKAVKLVGNYVTATNSHSIYKGNQLVPTGKVNVGNG